MEMDEDRIICRTVADLTEALRALPTDMRLYAHEPPFTGILLVPDMERGRMGVHSLWSTAEGRAQRAAEKATMMARAPAA